MFPKQIIGAFSTIILGSFTMGNRIQFVDNFLNRDEGNLFLVLKNFAFLRKHEFKKYYANSSGPEILVELTSMKKNVMIRFLWSGNSDLQVLVIKSGFFNNKEINILDISHNESKKNELIKLDDCEDVNLVLEKYSSFFELEVIPFLKKKGWI